MAEQMSGPAGTFLVRLALADLKRSQVRGGGEKPLAEQAAEHRQRMADYLEGVVRAAIKRQALDGGFSVEIPQA